MKDWLKQRLLRALLGRGYAQGGWLVSLRAARRNWFRRLAVVALLAVIAVLVSNYVKRTMVATRFEAACPIPLDALPESVVSGIGGPRPTQEPTTPVAKMLGGVKSGLLQLLGIKAEAPGPPQALDLQNPRPEAANPDCEQVPVPKVTPEDAPPSFRR